MKCEEVKKLFSGYLMLETDSDTTENIRAHIFACPECRGEFETSAALWTRLEILPVELPGENLKKGFYQMLEKELDKEKTERKGFRIDFLSRLFLQKRLLSPAMLLLLMISAFLLGIFVTSGKGGSATEGSFMPGHGAPVKVFTADQSGVLNLLDAYVSLRTGENSISPPTATTEDPGDMSIFEFFANVAFSFADYFEKIVTL